MADSQIAGSGINADPPIRGTTTGWTDERCNGCHRVDPVFSHPIDVSPGSGTPESLPLRHGRMTCLTCHDGDSAQAHAAARTDHTSLLRQGFSASVLCAQCHRDSSISAKAQHTGSVRKAHLAWPDAHADRRALDHENGLDRESESCLECHDGMIASSIGSHRDGMGFASDEPREHPIGVPYRAGLGAEYRDGMARMVHPDTLDERIRLFDGNVGCGSCHSVYSRQPAMLVMSNKGSRLCLSCHDG